MQKNLLAFAVAMLLLLLLLLMMMMKTCEMKNFYPKLASISLSTTVLRCVASANGHMSALNPVALPSASAVALPASLSWRCFMEWKTRCALAVAVSHRFFSPFSSLRSA